MNAGSTVILCVGALLLGACSGPEKRVTLFDGKSFEGWTFDVRDNSAPESIWSVRDGVLVCNGKDKSPGVIRTADSYENYELHFEWRWPGEPGNSGCLIHATEPRFMNPWPKSIEVQLYNQNAGDFWVIGETIEVPAAQMAPDPKQVRRRLNLTDDSEKPPGEWNEMRIQAVGDSVTVYVNGDLVNKGTGASVSKGAICLQAEGANVEFRNIWLRPMAP